MDVRNAFLGKKQQPSAEELASALGPAAGLWNELVEWMAANVGAAVQEWKGVYVDKYGWSLTLKLKKRTIVYLAPCTGCFRAAFTLSKKAVQAARAARLPKRVREALEEAPRYPEGTGLRLMVKKAADLGPIRKLAEIKSAN